MEELIEPYMRARPAYALFKSNVCHRLKELGDIGFLADLLDSDAITDYYDAEWYPECLYSVIENAGKKSADKASVRETLEKMKKHQTTEKQKAET